MTTTQNATQTQVNEYLTKIAQLEAQVKAQASQVKALSCKIGNKGGISVYGMGRFPVTLYPSQWIQLAGYINNVLKYCKDNEKAILDRQANPIEGTFSPTVR